MKKLILALIIIVSQINAQSNKGKISLIFNEERFDLPITQVYLRKENDVLISTKAERNDSIISQMISMEFAVKSLKENSDFSNENAIRLFITSEVKNNRHREKRFAFNYGPKDANVELWYGQERISWTSPSFQFIFSKISIEQSNAGLLIKGNFSGKYSSNNADSTIKTSAEIKEGYFEIFL